MMRISTNSLFKREGVKPLEDKDEPARLSFHKNSLFKFSLHIRKFLMRSGLFKGWDEESCAGLAHSH